MFKDYVCFNSQSNLFEKLDIEGIPIALIKSDRKNEILTNIQEKKKQKQLVIVEGGILNRFILEQKDADILVNPEKGIQKDFLHSRNSGLNQVLCKLARQNNVAIGFSFSEILHSEKEQRAELFGRMMQNVRLCRKYNVRMVLGSFAKNEFELRSKDSLISFGIFLGMRPEEAKRALER